MAQPPQLPADQPPPSTAWLLCAASGPLDEGILELAGVRIGRERGICYEQRQYAVREPQPFPLLQQWLNDNPSARESLQRLETLRSRYESNNHKPTHAEIAGSARAALLLGRGSDFNLRYKQYIRQPLGTWHPDPWHHDFWKLLLGPGLHGGDGLPEGEARQELSLLQASAFAFHTLPHARARGKGLCGTPAAHPLLGIATALRTGDAAAMEECRKDRSPLAQAACELMEGHFSAAHQHFETYFGRRQEIRYRLTNEHGLPLLIYALINAIYSGANARLLREWFDTAHYLVQYGYPSYMQREQNDIASFLDNLEQAEEMVNQNIYHEQENLPGQALTNLPFALLYPSLPQYARERLSADALAESIDTLEQQGMNLLACYGAAGLRQAPTLSPEKRARLQTILHGTPETSLPTLHAPTPERALDALLKIVQKEISRSSSLQRQNGRPPTLVATRIPTGMHLELGEHIKGSSNSAVLRCIKKWATKGRLVLEGASAAELTRLCVAIQEHVEIAGSLALPEDPEEAPTPTPVLLLAHLQAGRCLAALRLRLLPGTTPLMTPAYGLHQPILERAGGETIAVQRHPRHELAIAEQAARALEQAGFAERGELLQGAIELPDWSTLTQLLHTCRQLGLETCWEKGHALKLHQPQGKLTIHLHERSAGWLELGGELPVDEGRVLELTTLLNAFSARESNTLEVGIGEYVMLTPALERQLTLLELIRQDKRGKQGIIPAALPLLNALELAPPGTPSPPATATPPPAPPATLQATLRPYQLEGFRWLAQRAEQGIGALLADDMGLGKTIQVLALLLHTAAQGKKEPSLVLAPVTLLGNWAEEAARFAPSLRIITYDPRKPHSLENLTACDLVIASYGQLTSRQDEWAAQRWNLLVLDEAQAIKNPDSQRAQAVCTLTARARLCLTGTPIENSLLDLWSQMRFLSPGLFGSRASFLRRFAHMSPQDLPLLRQVLAPLFLRRTKAEVLTQLPPLTETIQWVEFTPEERALYESVRRSAVEKLEQDDGGISILAELTRLRRACCHGKLALAAYCGSSAKLAAMADKVAELRAAGRRVLIFSQFTDVLDLAQSTLQEQSATYLRLDGSTPAAQRSKLVARFQRGEADIFLISLKAGGAGLNLTMADYVILLDPWWNPAVEAQAAGRAHRMGQAQPVTLCRFMVRGTVEERILALHREKRQLAESILSGGREGMSLENLRALLTP